MRVSGKGTEVECVVEKAKIKKQENTNGVV